MQAPTLLVDIDHRPAVSLDGAWHYIVDPYRNGWGDDPDKPNLNGYAKNAHFNGTDLVEYDFATSPVLQVPGDWNSQHDNLLLYEGLVWYEKDFSHQPKAGMRTFLHFGAANHRASVFVNDVHVCDHEGGFTPFDCEVTNVLKPEGNFVVVAVDDSRRPDTVPAMKTDWWNYGGLTRQVFLVDVPQSYVDDYSLQLRRGAGDQIEGYVHLVGSKAGSALTLRIPELNVDRESTVGEDGNAKFSFAPQGLVRWAPDHPKLYRIQIKAGEDHLDDDIGFRTVEVEGDRILLNGKPIFLRGINTHAEAPYRGGRAWSQQDADTLLGWVHELHGNFVRLAHYPHDEHMTREADKLGILVWSEVPTYWSIDWKGAHALESAKQQLSENIRRDHNKASVILWSVSNETPKSPERLIFLKALVDEAHAQDPTRLVTSALLTHMDGKTAILDDPLGASLDVLGSNEYIGWYNGKPEDAPLYTWQNPYNKPLIMSEWGGGAKSGLHGEINARFSEEMQAEIFKQQLAMLSKIPFLAGTTPWVLMDFRSPTRQLPNIQDFYNRKGVISNKGIKKKAFFVLQDYYAKLAH
ncbi:Beta-galactosidase [Acidisarcina polymorpha]|uniref:Beta-galactosidase n=1 Tax=Acidisarcina polymorpha TaxID=2211140 RepID=A0A2Z5FY72_9BACT|nr:Beta-galactosidase [Acidisarcina polymorpha]